MIAKKDLLELVSDLRGSASDTEVPVLLEAAAAALEACVGALEQAGVAFGADGRCACQAPEIVGRPGAGPLFCRKCGGSGPR